MVEPRRRSLVMRAGSVTLFGVVASIAGLSLGSIARAQAPEASGNPTAESVLKQAADFLKKAKSIAFDAAREQKIGTLAITTPFSIAVERPNRFSIRSKPNNLAAIDIALVSNGKTLSTTISQLKKYTEADAPDSIDALNNDPIISNLLRGMLITDLLAADPYKSLMDGVKSAKYSGSEQVEGVKAHHLLFSQDQFDWEIWIAADGDPVIKKARLEPATGRAKIPGQGGMKNLEVVTTFKNWQIDRPIAADTFVFKAPAGAQKADSLFGELGGGAGSKPESSPLLGKPAPKVQLKLLDGGNFQLEDHHDKEVVMMDFWATWCPPCVQELPILADVAKAYKDKGVAFRAINEQEQPAKIRDFLKSKNLDITVALDSAGEIGKAYGADAIPMLVLIDKKGIVKSVHIGYSPGIKKTLQKELDALLAGKDPAK